MPLKRLWSGAKVEAERGGEEAGGRRCIVWGKVAMERERSQRRRQVDEVEAGEREEREEQRQKQQDQEQEKEAAVTHLLNGSSCTTARAATHIGTTRGRGRRRGLCTRGGLEQCRCIELFLDNLIEITE